MNSLALIPTSQRDHFGALPPHVKQNYRLWCKAIHALDCSDNPGATALEWAHQLKVKPAAVFNKRTRFRRDGWQALVDLRDAGPTALGGKAWKKTQPLNLPPLAVDYLKKLSGDNKRKSRPAARAFLRQWERWRRGDASSRIPGFDLCPPVGPSGEYPAGWSERNLMSKCPSKFELDAARRGLAYAVGKRGPQIFTTRAGLHYMSHVQIDDKWHDHFVRFGRQLCRVVELDALDVFSGALVTWGSKPRLRRKDGTYDTGLQQHVPLLLAATFYAEGYSPLGTEIRAEHGTAAVSEAVRKLLHDATDGKITVCESGIIGEAQALIGWRGQGKGNFRHKAALESHHNLTHNELGAVPAQTGLSRDTRPEFTHGILQDDELLMKAAAILAQVNPARAAQLRYRVLDYHSAFLPLLREIYAIINARDWHKLEGWEQIPGNVQNLYRLAPQSDAWMTEQEVDQLPAETQTMLMQCVQKHAQFMRTRRISPAEVQQRERGNLLKLPAWAVAELIAPNLEPPFAEERTVGGAYFNLIQDAEINGADPMRFESRITKLDGGMAQLPDGKYLCVLNPFDPSLLFVHDAGKHFLGTAEREYAITRGDQTALHRAYGRQAHRLAEMTAPLIKRHDADIRAETRRLKDNAEVFSGQVQEDTAMDRKLDRRARRVEGDITDLGDHALPAATEPDGVTLEEMSQLQ